jgi:hypothetical protein
LIDFKEVLFADAKGRRWQVSYSCLAEQQRQPRAGAACDILIVI